MKYDAFISHASEDKKYLVRKLAQILQHKGCNIWYDEYTLSVGDSLRISIDKGLANSRFGIVILSPHFFRKGWPKAELDGLLNRELQGSGGQLLPVWHKVTACEVEAYSQILASRYAIMSNIGIKLIAEKMTMKIRPDLSETLNNRPTPPKFADYEKYLGYNSPHPLEQSNVRYFLSHYDPAFDWNNWIDTIIKHLKELGLKYTQQLNLPLQDTLGNVVLESIYQRIFGRSVDSLGKIMYLPLIYFNGIEGVRNIELSLLRSDEINDIVSKQNH